MNYYFDVLKKYAVFEGRARRKEYWIFILVSLIIGFILEVVIIATRATFETDISLLAIFYRLGLIVPSISVAVRRIHDTNKSGWYSLIPFYNLVLLLTEGTKGSNSYGPDPRESAVDSQ